ncbi:MAG: Flp pilus assembly protein CpaB [Armatimonadota bacterium]|nr:Flp pilus assembly protein CpaB [Armatimonadota bacterium]
MARNSLPIIIIGAILGVLAIGLTIMMFLPRRPAGPPPVTTAEAAPPRARVVVATRDIAPRTVITRDMVREEEVEATQGTAGGATNAAEVVGKMAGKPVYQGEPVTPGALVQPIQRVVPANFPIPIGMRAVAVWVDPNQTAAGLVDVGDRVDVIVTHKLIPMKEGSQRIVGAAQFVSGRTIAQNLEVLAVDRSINAAPPTTTTPAQPGGAGGTPATGGETTAPPPPPPPAQPAQPQPRIRVLLAAPPHQAQRIVAANTDGTIHLTIRNPNVQSEIRLAEAREYPTAVVSTKYAERAETIWKDRYEARKRRTQRYEDITFKRLESKFLTPMPVLPSPKIEEAPKPGPAAPPPAPPTKEVMVIRGTEKSLVLVPR